MKTTMLRISALILLATAAATPCFAGAWTPKQFDFYEKLAFN